MRTSCVSAEAFIPYLNKIKRTGKISMTMRIIASNTRGVGNTRYQDYILNQSDGFGPYRTDLDGHERTWGSIYRMGILDIRLEKDRVNFLAVCRSTFEKLQAGQMSLSKSALWDLPHAKSNALIPVSYQEITEHERI